MRLRSLPLDVSPLRLLVQLALVLVASTQRAAAAKSASSIVVCWERVSVLTVRASGVLCRLARTPQHVLARRGQLQVCRIDAGATVAHHVIELRDATAQSLRDWFNEPCVQEAMNRRPDAEEGRAAVAACIQGASPYPAAGPRVDADLRKDPAQVLCLQSRHDKVVHHFRSMCASMMRLTSSAIETPRRVASFFRNFNWGSVNEIICFVMVLFRLRHVDVDGPVVGKLSLPSPCPHVSSKIASALPLGWLEAAMAPFAFVVMRIRSAVYLDADSSVAGLARFAAVFWPPCPDVSALGQPRSLIGCVESLRPKFPSCRVRGFHTLSIPQGIPAVVG